MYWVHLEVIAGTTLATLDRFLRDTWLERCHHLSAFTIGGVRYSVDTAISEWDTGSKNIQVRLDKVLHPGQTCSYEYDFGSTTELMLKVISEREVLSKEKAIEILAGIPCHSFHVMCAENQLPTSVVDASMKIRDACVMHARRTTNVAKIRRSTCSDWLRQYGAYQMVGAKRSHPESAFSEQEDGTEQEPSGQNKRLHAVGTDDQITSFSNKE